MFVLWCCIVIVCCCMVSPSVGSAVLVVLPVPSPSHTTLGDSIAKILLHAGHKVTLVTPYTSLSDNVNLNKVNISSLMDSITDSDAGSLVELAQSSPPAHRVLQEGYKHARSLLQHQAMQELMQDPQITFDLVVAEWYFSGLLAPLASVFGCPLVWYSAVDTSWLSLQLMHGPTSPVYTADPHARNMVSGYTIRDRVERLLSQAHLAAWFYYMSNYVESPAYYELYTRALVLRDRPILDYESLVYNASLMLVNSSPLLGQSVALPQSVKYVGGHHIDVPTKPLPKKLQVLLDSSVRGVILFNLGSEIRSKDLTERTKRRLLGIFGELEQTVIWQLDEPMQGVPRNVHIVKWAPQRGILSHKNTVLLITHGGFLSVMEATYFGVPIVGIPLLGDQYLTMDLVRRRGRGVRLDLGEHMPYRLYQAIQDILTNDSYQIAAKQAASIFQNQLSTPKKDLLFWIETVLLHGGEHLRSPAVQVRLVQWLYLDVVGVMMMFLWFLSKVVKVIRVHWSSDEEEDVKKEQ